MKPGIDIREQTVGVITCWAGVLRNIETLRLLGDSKRRVEFVSKIEVSEP